MKVLIRGHIRNSFDNDTLYQMCKRINDEHGIELYLQTWNVYSNSLSWRPINSDNTVVTKEVIYEYFKDLSPCIKFLQIDSEKYIYFKKTPEGKVGGSPMPMLGWKYLIYSMFNLVKMVKDNFTITEPIILTRYDINLIPHNNLSIDYILEYINNFKLINPPLIFAKGNLNLHTGCENLIYGNIDTIYNLLYRMWNQTGAVVLRHAKHGSQEKYFVDEYNYMVKHNLT